MKYKKLTKEQLIISIDRLTRFKNTREKYIRVFSDILVSNLIEPKLKKNDIEKMDLSLITHYVEEIINGSINNSNNNIYINNILCCYENSVFINDKETQKLLNNNINYTGIIDLISEGCHLPINLRWLKEMIIMINTLAVTELEQNIDVKMRQLREDKSLKFPVKEVILVEGITEEILLPVFAEKLGYDFYSNGIQIIPAGGKNQVVKMYYKLANELKIPIFILLDKDAEENISQIKPRLRDIDRIHLVSCGEFEDLLPKSLIIKTVNAHFKNFLIISESDIESPLSTVKVLEEIFKTKGLHEFKKAEFAKLVQDKINEDSDISQEIKAIIREINITNKMLDTKICS